MKALGMLALLLLLFGCGAGKAETGSATVEKSRAPASSSPSPTSTPTVTKVSDQVICQLVFEVKDGLGPIQRIIDDWDKAEISPAELELLKGDVTTVSDLSDRAEDPLSGQLGTYAQVIDSYVKAATTGEESAMTRTDLQGAGLSLINTCEDYF